MDSAVSSFWQFRLEDCKKALEKNNFEVFIADNPEQAQSIFMQEILPQTQARSFSWGDSLTMEAAGALEAMKQKSDLEVIVTFDDAAPREELMERRRQALLVDLFITGSNAITEDGHLVNLDMVGNRVGAITFGPRHVVIFAGRNKIVPDLQAAMDRIKNYAAPANAIRHEKNTPCSGTGFCHDCTSPNRICNTWTITEKSYPKGRVKVILINADLGL